MAAGVSPRLSESLPKEARMPDASIQSDISTFPQRSAALRIDWTKVTSSLGLKGQTAASLQAFKKRNEDARRKVVALSETPQSVDFGYYRSVLKNTAIVDEIENHMKTFKPVTYDVDRQLKAIDAFEQQAVRNAQETKGKVDAELTDLEKTLKNIEEARPFEDLTVVSAREGDHWQSMGPGSKRWLISGI
ncbi:MAG: ATP synthase d subunit [Sclerophora amabilis]|nr:MAG: ATP synthase d subunit [Sclerophora amabilis]